MSGGLRFTEKGPPPGPLPEQLEEQPEEFVGLDTEPSEVTEPGPGVQPGPQPPPGPPENMPESLRKLAEFSQMPNIAASLPDELLNRIGQRALREFEIDDRSRKEWLAKVESYKDLAMQRSKPKSYPFDKASNIIWPLLSMATNEFAAAAYPAIVPGPNLVKGMVVGEDKGLPVMDPRTGQIVMDPKTAKPKLDPESLEVMKDEAGNPIMDPATQQPAWYEKPGSKRRRADLTAKHMNWQLLSQDRGWSRDTDMLVRRLPVIGGGIRKVWFDRIKRQIRSALVRFENLVVNYNAVSWEVAPRITEIFELYPYQIEERIRSGQYLDFEYDASSAAKADGDTDAAHIFYEQHRRWDLDGDGYAEPYIVTIHKASTKVVSIVVGFELTPDTVRIREDQGEPKIESIERAQYYFVYNFIPNIDSAVYPNGWGHMLGPINEAINTSVNQMFDAGHLQNAGGGFIGSQLSMHSGVLKFKVGEYKVVNAMGSNIRDAIVTPDFKGPSATLFQLLGALLDTGRELGGMRDVLQGNSSPASTDPATLYAIMEQGQKVFKDIFKRIYDTLQMEFKRRFELNARYLQKEMFTVGDQQFRISRDDYAQAAGVEPVADPDMVTDIQKMGRAQFLLSFKDDPAFNGVEIRRRACDAVNIDGVDELLIEDRTPSPMEVAQLEAAHAEIAKMRAEEIESQTNALKHMMEARKLANDIDGAFFDKQIKLTMIHLESVQNMIQAVQANARVQEIEDKRAERRAANRSRGK